MPMRWIIRMLQCLTGGESSEFHRDKIVSDDRAPPPPPPTPPQSPSANMCCNSMHQLAQRK